MLHSLRAAVAAAQRLPTSAKRQQVDVSWRFLKGKGGGTRLRFHLQQRGRWVLCESPLLELLRESKWKPLLQTIHKGGEGPGVGTCEDKGSEVEDGWFKSDPVSRSRMGVSQIRANERLEDRAILKVLSNGWLLATVLDGHGGWQVAEYSKNTLADYIENALNDLNEQTGTTDPFAGKGMPPKLISEILKNAYLDLDRDILNKFAKPAYTFGLSKSAKIGACCISAIVTPSHVVIANTGDCQGIFVTDKEIRTLSNSHSANEVAEQQRLRKEHPEDPDIVVCKSSYERERMPQHLWEYPRKWLWGLGTETVHTGCYVKGRLQPTRSLGDFYLKSEIFNLDHEGGKAFLKDGISYPYITAEPETTIIRRNPSDRNAFLLLASDGVWDFMSPEEAGRLARKALKEQQAMGSGVADVSAAADRVIEEVVRKAMVEAEVASVSTLALLPPKQRRKIYDDTTVCIVRLD